MPAPFAPVAEAERIEFLDLARGFAVLGILAMNIQSFSMPGAAYFNPFAWGDFTGANRLVWWLANTFANQKFMTLFAMLFGAGIVLMHQRAAAAGRRLAGLHARRMAWLLAFGLAHAYLLWTGDILVAYAITGLLVFPFRRARPRWLLLFGLIFLAIGSGLMLLGGLSAEHWPPAQVLEFQDGFRPDAATLAKELADFRGPWSAAFARRAVESLEMQLFVIPTFLLWRAAGSMLLGMALFRWGVLGGGARAAVYRHLLAAALLVGLPATIWGGHLQIAGGWDPIPAFFLHSQWGYWGSLLLALGWLSALALLARGGRARGPIRRLAACGRMAFTNYVLQTVICTTLFYGHGLGLFGKVSRVGQAGLTLAIWLLLLWLSPLWLARFRAGPLEWLWRSLAYRRRQPWRRAATA